MKRYRWSSMGMMGGANQFIIELEWVRAEDHDREVEQLKKTVGVWKAEATVHLERAEKLEAENKRLKQFLDEALSSADLFMQKHSEAQDRAEKLKEEIKLITAPAAEGGGALQWWKNRAEKAEAELRNVEFANHALETEVDQLQAELATLRAELKKAEADRVLVLKAVKHAYLKHCLNSDNIGWEELDQLLLDTLCNILGDDGYQVWLNWHGMVD